MIEKPIIFIGTGRSGSTFISGAVFSHKDLGYPSNYQQKIPQILGINLIRRIFDNRFWRFYTRGQGNNGWLHKLIFLPSEAYNMWRYLVGPRVDFARSYLLGENANPEEVAQIHAYFIKMLRLQGKKRLAFKITGPSRIGYLLSIFPDAQFVLIKRRLIPTLNSFLKVNFWETRGKNRFWFTGAYTQEEEVWAKQYNDDPALLTAFQLGRINGVTQMEINRNNASVLDYDYEDFVKAPEKSLKLILDFLELDDDFACFDYLEKNPVYVSNRLDNDYFSDKEINSILKAYNRGLETISI